MSNESSLLDNITIMHGNTVSRPKHFGPSVKKFFNYVCHTGTAIKYDLCSLAQFKNWVENWWHAEYKIISISSY